MNKFIIVLASILLMSGCSAQWHLNIAIKKDPTILKEKIVSVTDTVVTDPIVVKDTVTLSQIDTVEIIKDKFRVKIMRSYDTLIIDGGCDADTIIRTIKVPIKQVTYIERNRWYDYIFKGSFFILVALILTLGIFRVLKKGW